MACVGSSDAACLCCGLVLFADFPEDRTETTEESCTMALSHVDADMAQDHKLMQVDGHMRDLRTQLESLVIEFQNASAKRAQLLEDSNLCSCEVSEKDSELLGRVEGLCSKSREWSDSNEKELCKLAEGSGHEVKKCFRSKTGPQGHMRHSSGCDPEPSCSSNGNSGELSGFSHPSEDNLQPDGIILEQILETGDGEFVMDDEIDGICSVDLSQGQSTDLPTPRVFLHSGAFEPNFLNEEQHPEAFDSEVTDCDESICCEDPDDPGTIDVGNPPFAPMETQLPRPTPTWNGDDGVNEDDPCTWLSNTTFGSANGGAPEGFQSPVQFRTTHVALVEQANRANRLMNELRQTQLTLEDVQGQLDFTTERMIAYKHSMQYEQTLRMSETVELKLALDEATSSKFIMFCRLQESQTKIKNLEEEISSLQEGCANAEDAAQLKDLDEDSVICESDQSEASSKESPRPHDMQELEFNQSGFSMTLSSSNGSGGTEIVQQVMKCAALCFLHVWMIFVSTMSVLVECCQLFI